MADILGPTNNLWGIVDMNKTTIINKFNRATEFVLEVIGLNEPDSGPMYDIQPQPLRPHTGHKVTIHRMPEPRPGLSLVPKPFDPDNRLHQRYLEKATEKQFQGGTDAIQIAMGKVGVDLSDSQAFDALSDHVAILQSSGIEL